MKDKTRSIVLDGDVADKAQQLADDKMLSSTLSMLLRNHYGLTSEIEAAETRLHELVNTRMQIREQEEQLADWIDTAKRERLIKIDKEKPHLERKLKKTLVLHDATIKKLHQTNNVYEKDRIRQVISNQKEIIDALEKELEELA